MAENWWSRLRRGSRGGAETGSNTSASWEARIRRRGLSQAEFTTLFADAARERFPGATVDLVRPLEVLIVLEDGLRVSSYLDNAWSEYHADPRDGAEIVERLLRSVPQPDAEPAPESIVPVIKDDRFIQQMAQFAGEVGDGLPVKAERLVADFWVVYANDTPDSLAFLTANYPAEIAELRGKAIENLKAVLPPVELHGTGPAFMLTAGGNFEASLLLLDGLWERMAEQVKGHLVVAVPSRDVLLLTGSDSPEGIAQVKETVRKITVSGGYLISETLLVRRENAWTPFAEHLH